MSEIKIIQTRPCSSQSEEPSVWRVRRNWAIIFALTLVALALYVQPAIRHFFTGSSSGTERIKIRLGGFSPDNRLLSYDLYRDGSSYAGLLDWHTGKIAKIIPPAPDEWWSSGCFSPSGKYLAYVVKRRSENSRWSQLGLYDIATTSLKKLTQTQSFKEFPSFSPDEKRLIYAQANRERESGKTRFSDWDIYELDIENGQERRLTNYEFFLIGQPHYLPDGRRFIFSGDSPSRFLGKVGLEASKEYEKRYQDNTIFIRGATDDTELRPAFTNSQLSHSPTISNDGKRIMYKARSDELNKLAGEQPRGYTYDIFMLEDGIHRRLTNLKSSLRAMTMSSDGNLIAYTMEQGRNGEIELWVLDLSSNQSRRISTDDLFLKKTK